VILKKVLNMYPDRVAVIDGDRSFTYAEIGDRITGLARFFWAQAILSTVHQCACGRIF
jgi:non-ribosomal peptide synthetase component E (peptide arylation enzyme)